MKLFLVRDYMTNEVTLGRMFNPDDNFHVHTLELPWYGNARRISCIPKGIYTCVLDFYNKGGYAAFEVVDVTDRSEIKIHIGNWAKDVLGCIAVGNKRSTGIGPMVGNSRVAFNELMDYMKENEIKKFELEIVEL